MKQGIILVNAYSNSEHEWNQPRRLSQELNNLGVKTKIVRNSPSALQSEADFCVYLDKDRYCAMALEKKMRLFNRARAIELCDDKMLTHLALEGFPMPMTVPSLLCYTPSAPLSEELLEKAKSLGFPLVVKECHGSLGRQVFLVKDEKELFEISLRLRPVPHLYQKFISESAGRDCRVIVVGGKAVAAMLRVSETDFRSNAELGGRGEKYPLNAEISDLCERVAARLGLDYCGIDLLFGKEGFLVCEVNSNAFFGSIERVTNINVARLYAEHILREISR